MRHPEKRLDVHLGNADERCVEKFRGSNQRLDVHNYRYFKIFLRPENYKQNCEINIEERITAKLELKIKLCRSPPG